MTNQIDQIIKLRKTLGTMLMRKQEQKYINKKNGKPKKRGYLGSIPRSTWPIPKREPNLPPKRRVTDAQ